MRKRGSAGYSLITSLCELVIVEEDAGKAGRVQDGEWNTNADAYLCSPPALTSFPPLGVIRMQLNALAGMERRRLRAAESNSCLCWAHRGSITEFVIEAQVLCELKRKDSIFVHCVAGVCEAER